MTQTNMISATVATDTGAHTTTHVYVRAIYGDVAHVHHLHNDNDYCGLYRIVPVSRLTNFRTEMIMA